MLLAIDIGNSNITLGGIQEGEILFEARLATDSTKTSDEYGVEIKDMLDLFGAGGGDPGLHRGVGGAVGVQLRPQRHREADGEGAMVVGPGIKTGINILLEDRGPPGRT